MRARTSLIAAAFASLALVACAGDTTAPSNNASTTSAELAKAKVAGTLPLAIHADFTIEGQTVTVMGLVTVQEFSRTNDRYVASGVVNLDVTADGITRNVTQPFTTYAAIGAVCRDVASLTVVLEDIHLPTLGIALEQLEVTTAQRVDSEAGVLICKLVSGFDRDNPLNPRITILNKILGEFLGTSSLTIGAAANITGFTAGGSQLYATADVNGTISVNESAPYVFNRTVTVPVTARATCGSTSTLALTTSARLVPEMPIIVASFGGTTSAASGTPLATLFCTLSTQLSAGDYTGAAATLDQIAPLL